MLQDAPRYMRHFLEYTSGVQPVTGHLLSMADSAPCKTSNQLMRTSFLSVETVHAKHMAHTMMDTQMSGMGRIVHASHRTA